jgi:hypothetical protein
MIARPQQLSIFEERFSTSKPFGFYMADKSSCRPYVADKFICASFMTNKPFYRPSMADNFVCGLPHTKPYKALFLI